MKYFFLLITLLLSSLFGYADQVAKFDQCLESKQIITPSFYTGVIHLSDLDATVSSGNGMYEINKPGHYYVVNNLSIAPDNNQVSAIKITVSNVVLNLNGTTIYQLNNNSATGLMGIEIAANLANIHISNGRFNGLNGTSSSGSSGGIIKLNSGVNNVIIKDVTVANCTTSIDELSGFLLNSCNNVQLVNCRSVNNTNTKTGASGTNGRINGFALKACSSCILQNCVANLNSSTDQDGFGFRLENSGNSYNVLLHCTALNQISSSTGGNSAIGFYTDGGDGNLFEKCVAIGNTGGSHASSVGSGFALSGGENNTTIKDCFSQANSGGTGSGYGLSISIGSADCNIVNNSALSNTGTNSGFGIVNGGSATIMYVSNLAHGNRIPASTVDNYNGSVGEISTAAHDDFTNIDGVRVGYNNLEVVA
jgi:hypothetical protein